MWQYGLHELLLTDLIIAIHVNSPNQRSDLFIGELAFDIFQKLLNALRVNVPESRAINNLENSVLVVFLYADKFLLDLFDFSVEVHLHKEELCKLLLHIKRQVVTLLYHLGSPLDRLLP